MYTVNLLVCDGGGCLGCLGFELPVWLASLPSRNQPLIDIRRAWLAKTDMKAKHIFVALINAPNPVSWQEEFLSCPTMNLSTCVCILPFLLCVYPALLYTCS